jgi:type IV pilus assembly protein PilW
MVETMVGILIGMLVVLVIYNVFSVSEQHRRTTTGVADAQVSGLIAQFTLLREFTSAGNGVSSALKNLALCADTTLHPIPVLVTDGGATNVVNPASDSFVVFYSAPGRVVSPVNVVGATAVGSAFHAQSPNGFAAAYCSAAKPCLVIAMEANHCDLRTATSVDAGGGIAELTVSPAASAAFSADAKVINLGQNGVATRTRYDVDTPNRVMRSQDLITQPGPNPVVPVASNVYLVKVQYGVDNVGDEQVHCWTTATNGACGDYSQPTVSGMNADQLSRIRAVRFGIVVLSDEYDRDYVAPTTYLFNCSLDTDADCQGRLQVKLPDNFRARMYETIVPLRNAIWNAP